jgi:hypothetical protein
LQAEIDAIRANKKYLDERRSKAIPQDEDSDDSTEEHHFLPLSNTEEKSGSLLQGKQLSPLPVTKVSPVKDDLNKTNTSVTNNADVIVIRKEQEISTDTQTPDSNIEQHQENKKLSIPKENCDFALVDDNGCTKTNPDNSAQSKGNNEPKEKRVTFLVENKSCDKEEGDNIEAFDEDIPHLQTVESQPSDLEKDTSKNPILPTEEIIEDSKSTPDTAEEEKIVIDKTDKEELHSEVCTPVEAQSDVKTIQKESSNNTQTHMYMR